jgi:hypothetical protein
MPTNFYLAPAAKMVDGLLAVPIDIQHLQASVVFDGATSSANAIATITFITGSQSGCPVFDLRQTIDTAFLDGVVIPVADIAHHNFGGGTGADMRIVNKTLPPASTHTLELRYKIRLPQSPAGGSYAPNITWQAGPRLVFNFGFTDLAAARYLEAWFPSNLIFDQFSIALDLQLINTNIAHSVITNASVTVVGTNHWALNFPANFTSFSPLLEIRATDTVVHQSDTVLFPVSGNAITINAWKLTIGAANLTTVIGNIKNYLINNENNFGSYLHGNSFTAFINIGGMEYDGGTTTGTGALKHEVFHSWWARGMKPASQPDSWWDEAWTTYFNDGGGVVSTPFDFTASPVELCTRNEWSRVTAAGAYTQGNRFWEGMSSLLGNANLNHFMKGFFAQSKNKLIQTTDLEAYLLSRSGNAQVVDAFHRFVYGFANHSGTPDLWLKDDATDTLGNNDWAGRFWDSPDIWVRNKDDNGLSHQQPEYGQDNWLYARVRNKSTSVAIRHFIVAFNIKQFAGTQFSYPADFLPCTAVATGFNLVPGASMVVKARWPRNKIPPAGNHACIVAAVITRNDHPIIGKFVWESNNLAQKNLTIVDLKPNKFIVLPFVVSNLIFKQARKYSIELFRPTRFSEATVSLLHTKPNLFSDYYSVDTLQNVTANKNNKGDNEHEVLPLIEIMSDNTRPITNENFQQLLQLYDDDSLHEMTFGSGKTTSIGMSLKQNDQILLYLKIIVPQKAIAGEQLRYDLVQRDNKTKRITGGIAILINVK